MAETMWKNVAKHEANLGLWTNEPPILEPTKKVHRKLLAEGKVQEAMALQAAVLHNVWTKERASDDPLMQKRTRCNLGEVETLLHRHWTCPNLRECDRLAVKKTQHLVQRATNEVESNAALWLGCTLTGGMIEPAVGLISAQDCITHRVGDFTKVLQATGVCGVDGSGGTNSSFTRGRSVGAGVGAVLLRDHGDAEDAIIEEAWLASKVPGRQTVPRAEIWVVLMVLLEWDGSHDLQIITDASYTVQGMDALSRRKNGRGPNRDIWRLIYAALDAKQGSGVLIITKVKSHIDGVQAYCRGTPYGHILVNELADFAAERYADHAGNGKADKNVYYKNVALLDAVCKRIAIIEATLREYSTDAPQVAADIISGCDAAGERRRQLLKEKTEARCKKFTSEFSHTVVFVPHNSPPSCKRCLNAISLGTPPNEACKNCGPGSGIYRCARCL